MAGPATVLASEASVALFVTTAYTVPCRPLWDGYRLAAVQRDDRRGKPRDERDVERRGGRRRVEFERRHLAGSGCAGERERGVGGEGERRVGGRAGGDEARGEGEDLVRSERGLERAVPRLLAHHGGCDPAVVTRLDGEDGAGDAEDGGHGDEVTRGAQVG